MRLLLLLRSRFARRRIRSARSARSAATAASASATRRLLQFACGGLRLLLRRTLRLLRTGTAATLRLLLALLLLLLLWLRLRAFAVALTLLLAIAASAFVALALALARLAGPLLFAAHLAGALLVLADLFLHEASRLLVEPRAQLVVTTVGTALPTFGIGLLAA